ncbi:cytidylate kinase, partial [Candidatus Woesearchaeota archaeon]|nr:cytidylate kinase [Candidatus Woesearchaeota archaeon]
RDSEIKRYQEYYGLNYYDHNNYDLVVDTTEIPVEEVAKKIIKFIEERK